MNGAFLDYYRCPESFATFGLSGELSNSNGFFHFGSDTICYGRTCVGYLAKSVTDGLYDVSDRVTADGSTLQLPFNPSEVVSNLRYERYVSALNGNGKQLTSAPAIRKAYYKMRPLPSSSARTHLPPTSPPPPPPLPPPPPPPP